jgi:hypothetical protein
MRGRTLTAAGLGALWGAVVGIVAVVYAASRATHTGLVPGPDPAAGALFEVTRSAAHVYVLIGGAFVGASAAAMAYAAARLTDPRDRLYPPGVLVPLGTVTGAAVAYAVTRAGFGAAATSILEGIVTITTSRAAVIGVVAGALTGSLVAVTTERLARPSVYRFEGEAWPADTQTFLRDAVAALVPPMTGVVAAGVAVFALSRLLLGVSHLMALVIFAGAAAVVLFGATAIAAREPRRRE